jgi:hypothetical protein
MRNKTEIRARVAQLNKDESDAADAACKRQRQTNKAERLQLQNECMANGGHLFVSTGFLLMDSNLCACCGIYASDAEPKPGSGLTTVAPLPT